MPPWLLLILEIVFISLIVAGVALIYIPAAMILGGFCGVVACERSAVVAENRRRHAETVKRQAGYP